MADTRSTTPARTDGGAVTNPVVADLIARSNRLGAEKRITNFAGGNTSAKGAATDPVTGKAMELLWVKGSGGFGKGGAAPSIDTAMHGLVEAAHVDHLHPDAGIAIATAADGEALTATIFGGKVAWVPWRRPGFQLGLDIAAIQAAHPEAVGVILGGHGITAWGATSAEAEAASRWIIDTAEAYLAEHGRADPFGAALDGYGALPEAERRAKAAALGPVIRGLASTDQAMVGHFCDDPAVLAFLAGAEHPRLGVLGTSCPDHFLRTKVRPLILDLPADAPVEESLERLKELHQQYRKDYAAYYERNATGDRARRDQVGAGDRARRDQATGVSTSSTTGWPAMRGADPAIVLVPGVGMFSYG
ncbi:class II aldolase/adducin family protein, partial [Specibacter cremeus]|uniref:class II aldolase/adducin family protein n=1 Tax=Specibacter cremeus TaxID=1629051 RepID=UPI00197C1826